MRTLACIVVFVTVYALILPAVTMERRTYCGLGEHTHDGTCGSESVSWSCADEWQTHSHRASCFDAEGNLVCGESDVLLHTHNAFCYDSGGTLLCPLEETAAHTHDDDCYTAVRGDLLCVGAEDGGHVHGEDCYDEYGTLICEEREGHIHSNDCYDCVLCLSCARTEAAEHEHTDGCYDSGGKLACDLPAARRHDHGESCVCTVTAEECDIPEHTHTLACYSNPDADVETAAIWEDSISAADRSGTAAERLLAVAETQLGYEESTKNYTVLADGETMRGYTRYGAWYGDPYGEWCAMFVSFCLHYAEVEELGSGASCGRWMADLAADDKVIAAEGTAPAPGDLVFIDTDGDRAADHMGIVTEWAEGKLATIEGNRDNAVCRMHYDADDERLLAYAVLSGTEDNAAAEQMTALIDALPTAEEAAATLAQYDEVGDTDGGDAYLTEIYERVLAAQENYDALPAAQQALVANAEKLAELLTLWPEAGLLTTNIQSDMPTTVASANTRDLIEVNLYDYNGNINSNYNSNKKYPGFQWNGGAHMAAYTNGTAKGYNRHEVDFIDFGNSNITDFAYGGTTTGITNGKSRNAVNVGKLYTSTDASSTGALNRLWWDGSGNITNRPVGMSTGIEALSRTLGSDGSPALSDGSSLGYLFTSGTAVTKQNSQSIDGLFQYDETTGHYSYDSRKNHAQYNSGSETFTLYDQIITPNFIVYPFGNFLPFNDITDGGKATQVSKITSVSNYINQIISDMSGSLSGSATKTQLTAMLKKYRDNISGTDVNTGRDAIVDYFTAGGGSGDKPTGNTGPITDTLLNRLYNIDWDEETNFFFGMEMKMNFMQPKGGMTGKDTNNDGTPDAPMEFTFAGDDDVWVYIDGVLFLDLSGIHRHVGGKIDFVNGTVSYYALDTANTGDVSETAYKTVTFKELLVAANKPTSVLNEKGTFKDYSTHSFNFYFMERGSGSSVCRMEFNLPVLHRNSITVGKELTADDETLQALGDPDFRFRVMKADGSGPFIGAGVSYHLYGADGNEIVGEHKTGTDGVFALKAGQKAVFTEIGEDRGKYYVQELLDPTEFQQYGKITVRGESDTLTEENVTIEHGTFTGVKGPVKDASDGSTVFWFENHIDRNKLGSLSITKVLKEGPRILGSTPFRFTVTLDGKPLPVGTAYTVGEETRTVSEEGVISLSAGETALIKNILAGTRLVVTETEESASGYTVTYQLNGETMNGAAEGVIALGPTKVTAVTVTNAIGGDTVTIPVEKTLENPNGAERTYAFRLVQATDETGTAEVAGTEQFVSVTFPAGETGTVQKTAFTLTYPMSEYDESKTLYYKITEVDGGDDLTFYDETVWLASVSLTRTDESLTATLTRLWREGAAEEESEAAAVAFRNVLAVYELPATGGSGTLPYTICGFCLLAAAVMLLGARGRRKERGTDRASP